MQGFRSVALAFLLATLVAPGALAADLGGRPGRGKIARPEPPLALEHAPPFSWSGLYLGGHVGYGWSEIDWQDGIAAGHDGSGWLAGGQIGYNLQAGRLVYGVEADISSGWIEGDPAAAGTASIGSIPFVAAPV